MTTDDGTWIVYRVLHDKHDPRSGQLTLLICTAQDERTARHVATHLHARLVAMGEDPFFTFTHHCQRVPSYASMASYLNLPNSNLDAALRDDLDRTADGEVHTYRVIEEVAEGDRAKYFTANVEGLTTPLGVFFFYAGRFFVHPYHVGPELRVEEATEVTLADLQTLFEYDYVSWLNRRKAT